MSRLSAALAVAVLLGGKLVACAGKNPGRLLGAGWPAKATLDPGVVAAWERRWPNANPGLVLYAAALSFDVDDPDWLHEAERVHGALPLTPGHPTGGDEPPGRHRLYFRHPGIPLRAELGDKAIELIHGPARQVLIPPAVHPVSGAVLEWEHHPAEVPLAPLPDSWLALVAEAEYRPRRPQIDVSSLTPEEAADWLAPQRRRERDLLLRLPMGLAIEALTGLRPNRFGYIACPLHNGGMEQEPSLKLYPESNSWACFGCPSPPGRKALGGTIIDFSACLWGVPLPLPEGAYVLLRRRLAAALLGEAVA